MSDTPRTDAASFNEYCEWIGEKRELVAADDMRQLERALARYEQAELPEEPPVMSCSLHEGWFRETDYYALRAHAAKVTAERGEAAPRFGGAKIITAEVKAEYTGSATLGRAGEEKPCQHRNNWGADYLIKCNDCGLEWWRDGLIHKVAVGAEQLAETIAPPSQSLQEAYRRRGELLRDTMNALEDNLFCATDCDCYQRRVIARIKAELAELKGT